MVWVIIQKDRLLETERDKSQERRKNTWKIEERWSRVACFELQSAAEEEDFLSSLSLDSGIPGLLH